MSQLGYTIEKKKNDVVKGSYTPVMLSLMTTHRLREICREEKIIENINNPLDKDELIRIILKYRSADDNLLIQEYDQSSFDRLSNLFKNTHVAVEPRVLSGCAKLVCYEGLAVSYFDNLTIDYIKELVDTNAVLVSNDQVCAIFNVGLFDRDKKVLHLTKSKEMLCKESNRMQYTLYCFDKHYSKILYNLYMGHSKVSPKQLKGYAIEVLNFSVRPLMRQTMPLAIDFGTSNTTAGMYLDAEYFERLGNDPVRSSLEQDSVNYVNHLEPSLKTTAICPSVIGVMAIEKSGAVEYVYGHEAKAIASNAYMDENFSLFYDIKRWISDYNKSEALIDRQGNRSFVPRKEIIAHYIDYIIESAKQRFKCDIKQLHLTTPVKQQALFITLFKEILPSYTVESHIDEGISVLYSTIGQLMKQKQNGSYKALVIDCGGGTTDLSSLTFDIADERVAYNVNIQSSYENGDTDFGGNNLTYRLMQLIKIAFVDELCDMNHLDAIYKGFRMDIFRELDSVGKEALYSNLESAYQESEQYIPTQFQNYEHKSREAYYKVKNNYYYLFDLAEKMKIAFYSNDKALRVALTGDKLCECGVHSILTEQWKLCLVGKSGLTLIKDMPTLYFNVFDIEHLLTPDIYHIVKKFIEPLYNDDSLFDYDIIKLTGQSCKVRIFKDALKEFVPGKIIEFRNDQNVVSENALKLVCLDGAIQFLKDKKYGYTSINVKNNNASLPYVLTAYDYVDQETVLLDANSKEDHIGQVSRTFEDLTLKLVLKDANDRLRYSYSFECSAEAFKLATYEEIDSTFDSRIPQDYVDAIVNEEIKFFIYPDYQQWGFHVQPILRRNESLMIGKGQFYLFENEGWVTNFFDGTK